MSTPSIPTTKVCTKCHENKPLDAFAIAKNGRYGRRGCCKDCMNFKRRGDKPARVLKTEEEKNETKAKWRKANPDKVKETAKKWRDNNPEKKAEYNKRWFDANPEKLKESRRKWGEANPEKTQAFWAERNAAAE